MHTAVSIITITAHDDWRSIIVAHLVLLSTGFGNAETFTDQARAILTEVRTTFNIDSCIQAAEYRASQTERYGDRHYAALWFSMYSRDCLISLDLLPDDKGSNSFPYRLNKELRCQHTSYSDQNTRNVFLKVANVLDQSVIVIGQQRYPETFRGISTYLSLYEEKDSFVDESFVSVSTDINPALNFAKKQVLMIVKDYTGVYIANYAQEKFSYQKEVLGKSVKVFNIERRVNDSNEIASIMSTYPVNRGKHPDNPANILFIRQIQISQQALEEMIEGQSSYFKGYCSSAFRHIVNSEGVNYFGVFLIVYMLEF